MEKLQKEDSYILLSDKMYEKAINATGLFKLIPKEITCKFKRSGYPKQDIKF